MKTFLSTNSKLISTLVIGTVLFGTILMGVSAKTELECNKGNWVEFCRTEGFTY